MPDTDSIFNISEKLLMVYREYVATHIAEKANQCLANGDCDSFLVLEQALEFLGYLEASSLPMTSETVH